MDTISEPDETPQPSSRRSTSGPHRLLRALDALSSEPDVTSQPSSLRSTSGAWLRRALTRRFSSEDSRKRSWAEVNPAFWGISQADLEFFRREVWNLWTKGFITDNPEAPNPYHNDEQIGPNIYQVNEMYIKPTTLKAGGMSWALMRNPCGLKCDVFASHAWSEGVWEFLWKVSVNWPRHTKGLYCCFLANPQNSDIGSLLGHDPAHSPFARALEVCSHVLIVPNRCVSVYSRLWCVFEADLAMQHGLSIAMPTRPKPRSVAFRMLPYLFMSGLVCLLFTYLEGTLVMQPHRPWTPCNLQRLFVLIFTPVSFRVPRLYVSALCFAVGFQLAHWITHDNACVEMLVQPDTRARGMEVLADNIDAIFITLTSIECVITELVSEALADEGRQLESDTVENASCSNETDSRAIRQFISGREADIDRMIALLKQVGRYDNMVALNLKRGMHPLRVKDGVMHMRGVGGCCHWVEGVVRTIAAMVNVPAAIMIVELGMPMRLLCCVAMYCFTVWWGAGAAYFVDTLLLSSLVDHFCDEFLWHFAYKQRVSSVFLEEHNTRESLGYVVVFVIVGAVATSRCIWFYRRPLRSCIPEPPREEDQDSSTGAEETSDSTSEAP